MIGHDQQRRPAAVVRLGHSLGDQVGDLTSHSFGRFHARLKAQE